MSKLDAARREMKPDGSSPASGRGHVQSLRRTWMWAGTLCAMSLYAAGARAAQAAGTRVWDSRDLWATSPSAGSGAAGERLDGAFAQFADWPAYVEILIAAALALGLSWLIAFSGRMKSERVASLEERKTLVVIGFACAVIGALVLVQPMVAVLVVGLGLLLRMPALVTAQPLRSRALMVASIGFAVGFSQYLLAVFVAGLGWAALRWLGGHRHASIKVRIGLTTDRDRAKALIGETLARMNCRVHSVREGRSGRSFIYTVRMPASVADELLTKGLAATLAPEIGVVEVEIRED